MHSAPQGLRPYLDFLPQGGVKRFAEAIGSSTVYLLQLAARQDGRQPSPKLCVLIEKASKGVVRRWHLRNDWHEIWPELIGRKGAPAPRKPRKTKK